MVKLNSFHICMCVGSPTVDLENNVILCKTWNDHLLVSSLLRAFVICNISRVLLTNVFFHAIIWFLFHFLPHIPSFLNGFLCQIMLP